MMMALPAARREADIPAEALLFKFEGSRDYHLEGWTGWEADDMLRKRRMLRRSLKIQSAVVRFWSLLGDIAPDSCASFEAYTAVHRRVTAVLAPELTDAEAHQAAMEDWDEDVGGTDEQISLQQYARGLFSIADLWTDSVEESEYVDFLTKLFLRISVRNARTGKRELALSTRAMDQGERDDLASLTAALRGAMREPEDAPSCLGGDVPATTEAASAPGDLVQTGEDDDLLRDVAAMVARSYSARNDDVLGGAAMPNIAAGGGDAPQNWQRLRGNLLDDVGDSDSMSDSASDHEEAEEEATTPAPAVISDEASAVALRPPSSWATQAVAKAHARAQAEVQSEVPMAAPAAVPAAAPVAATAAATATAVSLSQQAPPLQPMPTSLRQHSIDAAYSSGGGRTVPRGGRKAVGDWRDWGDSAEHRTKGVGWCAEGRDGKAAGDGRDWGDGAEGRTKGMGWRAGGRSGCGSGDEAGTTSSTTGVASASPPSKPSLPPKPPPPKPPPKALSKAASPPRRSQPSPGQATSLQRQRPLPPKPCQVPQTTRKRAAATGDNPRDAEIPAEIGMESAPTEPPCTVTTSSMEAPSTIGLWIAAEAVVLSRACSIGCDANGESCEAAPAATPRACSVEGGTPPATAPDVEAHAPVTVQQRRLRSPAAPSVPAAPPPTPPTHTPDHAGLHSVPLMSSTGGADADASNSATRVAVESARTDGVSHETSNERSRVATEMASKRAMDTAGPSGPCIRTTDMHHVDASIDLPSEVACTATRTGTAPHLRADAAEGAPGSVSVITGGIVAPTPGLTLWGRIRRDPAAANLSPQLLCALAGSLHASQSSSALEASPLQTVSVDSTGHRLRPSASVGRLPSVTVSAEALTARRAGAKGALTLPPLPPATRAFFPLPRQRQGAAGQSHACQDAPIRAPHRRGQLPVSPSPGAGEDQAPESRVRYKLPVECDQQNAELWWFDVWRGSPDGVSHPTPSFVPW